MANLMIRNLDDSTKSSLRLQAARNGRSMEEEARTILRLAVSRQAAVGGLGSRVNQRFGVLGGMELGSETLPDRPLPDFGTDQAGERA